jgi:ABC-type nitrate/sulfonate/bicarbonate transport system ATPase subunit
VGEGHADRSSSRPEATERSFGTTPARTTPITDRRDPAVAPTPTGGIRLPVDRAADPTAPAIRLADVSFAYRTAGSTRPALARISLTVRPGEFLALVGANGTGKSTLLRLIGGLLAPEAGSVEIGGQAVAGPDPRVGLVFQEPRLLPWRSVLDNVAFPLELAGWDRGRREDRAREMLDLVGLLGVDGARPHELSGGMRQRASLARALAPAPAVLLLDEPFSALDALTRERLNAQLQQIWTGTGTTVVLVTHDVAEAVFLADRVAALAGNPGRLVGEVPIRLPRPRALDQLDAAAVSSAASVIRELLASDEERRR